MAKIHLDRLKKRYGFTGENYAKLINKIILQNSENVARQIGRVSRDNWTKAMNKISTTQRRFIVPDVSEVLPSRMIFINKAADRGKLISDSLRDSLTKNLRDTMDQFTPKTGEARYIIRRGEKAGRINPKLIGQFEGKVRDTFSGYTKKDPALGMPGNIHTIAVTEMRMNIGMIKREYVDKLISRNPDLRFDKRWIHNRSLSKIPRPGHIKMDGKTIPYDSSFVVPMYKKIKGRWMWIGQAIMANPHDPQAPRGEVIGCNCDIEYVARKPK